MSELPWLSLCDAIALIRKKKLSPLEYLEGLDQHIAKHESGLSVFLYCDTESALTQAKDLTDTQAQESAHNRPLYGIPFAIKDVIDAAGLATTAHSKILKNNVAKEDANVTAKLKAAGGILFGKTATHEFAIGGPSFDLPWPPARNPWDPACHPGASSSGSGAGIAAGFFPAAIGTDTAGSVRFPASACGIVGMKPTYGLVSRHGTVPLSFSNDHVGPLTRTVRDNALLLSIIAGPDDKDPGSAQHAYEHPGAEIEKGIKGLHIGVARSWYTGDDGAHPVVIDGIEAALRVLSELGATIVDVDVPSLQDYASCAHIIRMSEAYAIHREWLADRPGDYGALARERLMRGAGYSAADYIQAQRWRRQLMAQTKAARHGVDVIITASNFDQPCRIDDIASFDGSYARQARVPFNVTGEPAMAIPIGFDENNMPLSMQITAGPFEENIIYRVARAYEQATDWADRRPILTQPFHESTQV